MATQAKELKALQEAKTQENLAKQQELHKKKQDASNQQFKDTKVTSCSSVLIKNGQAVCVAFKGNDNKI